MSLSKRSQVTVQFNWIFVLAVGAVLMIFFASIATRQKEVSETELAATVSADLSSILAGAAVSTGTFELIDTPKIIIKLDCDFYTVGAITKQFKEKLVFGASRLEGEQLITWSLDWNAPFRIANFLLLTTPGMRFIIADPGAFAQEIYDELPPETMNKEGRNVPAMAKELVDNYEDTYITNKNNFKVRIIFFGELGRPPDALKYLSGEDLTALVIKGDDFEYGSIEFYQYDKLTQNFELQPQGETRYLGMASLFAAVFTDRASDYNCLMDKAFTKLSAVSKIYSEREQLLLERYSGNYCESYYNIADSSYANQISQESSAGFEKSDAFSISSYMSNLENQNQQALIASCAQLY